MILVTGANGFIGGAVCAALVRSRDVRAVVRKISGNDKAAGPEYVYGDVSPEFDWSSHLQDVSVVVHCAARVHVLKEESPDPLGDFRATNVRGTMNLARQAATAGVDRFVFMSSIGVNGMETVSEPFRPGDSPSPQSDYAKSKFEAEEELLALAEQAAMEVVIIRPPLVYGPGAPGNFFSLIKWISRGVPLPLGGLTRNQRSFISVDNLVDLIELCLDHPAAANQVFLASDGEDLSTTDFLIRIGRAMEQRTRLIPVPAGLLYTALAFFGKARIAQSLCRSLEIDIRKTRELLGWAPAVSVDEGLRKAVADSTNPTRHRATDTAS